MVLHKMSAQHRDRKSDRRLYCIANYLTNCFTMRDMTELTAQTHSHLGRGLGCRCGRKSNGLREGEVRERQSLVRIQLFAW